MRPGFRQPMPYVVCFFLLASIAAGCSDGVREDRTADWSRDGKVVAFQHGDEGVFVAGDGADTPAKIHTASQGQLATSRPLFSPTDNRMIFATAVRKDDSPGAEESDPPVRSRRPSLDGTGDVHFGSRVRYTCWIQEPEKSNLQRLFEADCDHAGYVAAGLVIRWHPLGQRVLYLASVANAPERHSVFEFDIATAKSRQVFPHSAAALLFDFIPGSSGLLACVVGGNAGVARGIWIGTPGDNDSFWRIPESRMLAPGESSSPIESVRASRPSWTRDGTQGAFVARISSTEANTLQLYLVDVAARAITPIADAYTTDKNGSLTDLFWSPDGRRLAFVQRNDNKPARLRIAEPNGSLTDVATAGAVRRFAGFDSTGERLAYVVPEDDLSEGKAQTWASLLLPVPDGRNRVWIKGAADTDDGREVFSGMQVTFPSWSPKEDKLSLWLTFVPRYMSYFSLIARLGLHAGDPAATLDVRTGAVTWMAVSPQEELQIGHYHLLKHDYAEAWRRYSAARLRLPPAKPPEDTRSFVRRVGAMEQSQFFEYLCLKKLRRDAEAQARLEEFDATFFPDKNVLWSENDGEDTTDSLESDILTDEFSMKLLKDFYVAEVMLSVDQHEESLIWFRAACDPGDHDTLARLSGSVVLAQLLLLADRNDEFLIHCTETVAPIARDVFRSNERDNTDEDKSRLLQALVGAGVGPMFNREFIDLLPEELVRKSAQTWSALREVEETPELQLAADLYLRNAYARLEVKSLADKANQRVAANPLSAKFFAGRDIDASISEWLGK
jgi:hypothetical protein